METKYLIFISSIGIAIFSPLIAYLSYRNKKKYQKPVINVDAQVQEDLTIYRESMGPSYSIIVRVKNTGMKSVSINHPLTLKVIDKFNRELISPINIVQYKRNVRELPHELMPESLIEFVTSGNEIIEQLKKLSGRIKLVWIVRDTLDRKYRSKKPIKAKIVEGKLLFNKREIKST